MPQVSPRLLALDARTGKLLWESGRNLAKKVWIAYSEKHDVLLVGGNGQTNAVRGADGQDLWTVKSDGWSRPPIVLEDSLVVMNLLGDLTGKTILTDYDTMYRNWSFYNLKTGQKEREFEAPGAYCGYGVAARNLIALRSTSAACYDLAQSRLTNLAGFRTGCVSNLIPAGGLLNAPFFAEHCACNYPIFTSLGLVHMPELAAWVKIPAENARLSKRNLNP
jgi:hypothetical protein